VTGIGAAAALTGGILYIVGAGDISSAEKRCPTRTCPANAMASQQTGNTGRGLENVGGPLIGIGAGALVAGLLWHFLEKPTSAPPATATMVSPVAVAGYGGVAVFGRF
jgi:hypothetical protein